MSRKALIAGVDPGSTSAVAAVTLEGEIVLLESGKNFPPNQIIRRLVKTGKPVVLAGDKSKTPSAVKEIASSLGAKVFKPEKDLKTGRKKELGKGSNSHEVDASAAAYHAQRKLEREITKIKNISERENVAEAKVAGKYFSDKALNFETNSKGGEKDLEESESQQSSFTQQVKDENIKRKERRIENLEDQVEALKSELGEVKAERDSLKDKVQDLKGDARAEAVKEEEVRKREGIIREKNREIEALKSDLEDANVREKQYSKALRKVYEGAKVFPVVDGDGEEVPENAVTRSTELREKFRNKGLNIRHVGEVEGIELPDFFITDELPGDEPDLKQVVEEYRESR